MNLVNQSNKALVMFVCLDQAHFLCNNNVAYKKNSNLFVCLIITVESKNKTQLSVKLI